MQTTDAAPIMVVEAETRVPHATAQLTRFNFPSLDCGFVDESRCWLDFSLTSRPSNARVRFCGRGGSRRFERLGSVLMVPRGKAIRFRTDGGQQMSLVCRFDSDTVCEWLREVFDGSDHASEAGLDLSNNAIRTLLHRLGEELDSPGFAGPTMTELLIGEVLVEIARAARHHAITGGTARLATWRLRRIEERLADVSAAPSLAELAALCDMSVRQLTRSFRASRSCTVGDYITQCRMETAKRLLQSGQSIKTIALAMGYLSASHFSQVFRHAVGITPSKFRSTSATPSVVDHAS